MTAGRDSEHPIAQDPISGATHLVLRGDLTVSTTASLHAELHTALTSGRPIEIDAGGVERVDMAAMQLLWAFAREAQARRLPLQWTRRPDALTEAAATMGLDEGLGWQSATM